MKDLRNDRSRQGGGAHLAFQVLNHKFFISGVKPESRWQPNLPSILHYYITHWIPLVIFLFLFFILKPKSNKEGGWEWVLQGESLASFLYSNGYSLSLKHKQERVWDHTFGVNQTQTPPFLLTFFFHFFLMDSSQESFKLKFLALPNHHIPCTTSKSNNLLHTMVK